MHLGVAGDPQRRTHTILLDPGDPNNLTVLDANIHTTAIAIPYKLRVSYSAVQHSD